MGILTEKEEARYQEEFGQFKDRTDIVKNEELVTAMDDSKHTAVSAKKIQEAVQVLSDAVNVMGFEGTGSVLAIALRKQHRTLQASIMRGLIDMFKIYQNEAFDLRNRAAVRAAEIFSKAVESEEIYIPFI